MQTPEKRLRREKNKRLRAMRAIVSSQRTLDATKNEPVPVEVFPPPIAREGKPEPLAWESVNPPPQQHLKTNTVGGNDRLGHALIDGARSHWLRAKKTSGRLEQFAQAIDCFREETRIRKKTAEFHFTTPLKEAKSVKRTIVEHYEVETILPLAKKLDVYFGSVYGGTLGKYTRKQKADLSR